MAVQPALFAELESLPPGEPIELLGLDRERAERQIIANHYTHSVPSGKSRYVGYEDALVIWSIPANYNIGRFLLGRPANIWELARLWAPDGHRPNLLTEAISAAIGVLIPLERPELLVSYADPNAGHRGSVYRAASWILHGQSDECRVYVDAKGQMIARRAFHSGKEFFRKADIEAAGYREIYMPGKLRFVKPITRRAKRELKARSA